MAGLFDHIGEGRKNEVSYKIEGKDTGIFTPNKVTYMALAEVAGLAAEVVGAAGLSAGIAGLNLLVAVKKLALSEASYNELKRMAAKVDKLRDRAARTEEKLEDISNTLEDMMKQLRAIDAKVSENNLREALKYVLESAVVGDSILLDRIGNLERDVTNYIDSFDRFGYGLPIKLRLSSDVRDRLLTLYSFLVELRSLIAERHNIQAGGEPSRMLTVHPIRHYEPLEGSQFGAVILFNKMIAAARKYTGSVSSMYEDRMKELFHHVDPAAYNFWSEFVHAELEPLIGGDTDGRSLGLLLRSWRRYWLQKTDAGLIWRVRKELSGLRDYQSAFPHWQEVDVGPIGSDQLHIACKWER